MSQRILMLHSSSDMYGASKIFLITALSLRDAGHYIHVVLSEEGALADQIRKEGVAVSIVRLGILRRKYFNPKGLINRLRIIQNAHKELVKLVNLHKIDHIYSNTTAVLVGAWVARGQKIFHTWHIHEIIVRPKWLRAILGKIVGAYSDQVIVVSQAVNTFWSKYVPVQLIKVVYNGIDYAPYLYPGPSVRGEFSGDNDTILIGMIGRVSHWKGQSYFLEIASELNQSYPHLSFVIVGDAFPGSEHLVEEMRQEIKNLGLEEKVSTLGFRTDIPEIMAALDIFVLPSILPDPLPTVVLEAMASSKPVVATAHGGACEMVADKVTGFLIPWDDASRAAEQFFVLIEDEKLRKKMGERGEERVLKHFSMEAFHRNIGECFSEARKSESEGRRPETGDRRT